LQKPKDIVFTIKPERQEIYNQRDLLAANLSKYNLTTTDTSLILIISYTLLEKGFEYNAYNSTPKCLFLHYTFLRTKVLVEVKVALDEVALPELRELEKVIQKLRANQNHLFEVYAHHSEALSGEPLATDSLPQKTSPGAQNSKSNLLRIAFEAQSLPDFIVDGKNILSLSTIYQLSAVE
jgi:hypothetical protein